MLKPALRLAASLAMALTTLAACAGDPIAPHATPAVRASTVTASGNIISRDSATVPFSLGLYAPCANGGVGEVLSGDGTLHYTGHWITTTQGRRQHNLDRVSYTGVATGWDTGESYDIVLREFYQSNADYGTDGILDSETLTDRLRFHLTSRATGASFDITLVGRFVEAATGQYVISGWDGTARCN